MNAPLDAKEVARLTKRIAKHGLDKYAKAIHKAARPCVYLVDQGPSERPRVGSSYVGGMPDLPPDLDYPQGDEGAYLFFVGQINLAEAPPTPPLPESGLLSFFVEDDEDAGDVFHQVLYHPGDAKALRRARLPEDAEVCLEDRLLDPPHRVRLVRGLRLPSYNDELTQELFDEDEEGMDRYLDLLEELDAEDHIGFMLGYPRFASFQSLPKDTSLLLELNSIEDMQWWDDGAIQFLVPTRDPARKVFANTDAQIYTS
jgi:uncharacterized protein YwqG